MRKAAVMHVPASVAKNPLHLETLTLPLLQPGDVLVTVRACGVCRTDVQIVEGDLPVHRSPIVPGHQIVGVVSAKADGVELSLGTRVGISWLGGTDGTCTFCREGRENLCDAIEFTGYDRDGGYATALAARADFVYPLSDRLDDLHAAPLLCAGMIGFRALRVAGVAPGERVGLYGFGSSAHLVLPILKHWGCCVAVATRGANHRAFAEQLDADWVGKEEEHPPFSLDRAITFAPSGDIVIAALGALRKGGVVAINAIHLDRIPAFDYDSLLWGEREIRSVANMTRADGREFLELATKLDIRPEVTTYSLEQVNEALRAVRDGTVNGAAVISMTQA